MNKTKIYKNYQEFIKRKDKRLNGVSEEFSESYPNWENMNATRSEQHTSEPQSH